MQVNARNFVRALLPAAVIAFSYGCGGGGGSAGSDGGSASNPPPASAPAETPSPTPTPTPQPTPDPTPDPGTTPTPDPGPPSAGNSAPTITGTAGTTAIVGALYQFQPIAQDADGDPLTYTAANLPPWATLDPATGRISGTPTASDIGSHEAISVTVADGSLQASIAPFTIVVADAGSPVAGGASVQWVAPPSKMDGSPLDDLAGYRISYGRTADELDNSVYIEDPNATSYTIDSLESGVWYFAVSAVNASGLEGAPSIAVQKSI